jgi:hypothetical protein
MNKSSFELSVCVSGRTPIREFGHNGHTYVEGRNGQKFTLRFRNNTATNVLAVPSLDGLSAIDGGPATDESRGYIIPGYSSVEIKGWRTSLNGVSDFIFKMKESGETYAEQTDNNVANCGVIAVRVFEEKAKPIERIVEVIKERHHHHHHYDDPIWPKPYYPWYQPSWKAEHTSGTLDGSFSVEGGTSDLSNHAHTHTTGGLISGILRSKTVNQVSESPAFDMGTGFGEHTKDVVTESVFERGVLKETLEIYYASAQALTRCGINLEKAVAVNSMPQAFAVGYCMPPKKR